MADPKPVGYAVVGLGSISEVAVLPAFQNSQKSKLVALVSHDQQRAEQVGTKFNVKNCYSYEDYDRCLNRADVEAVFIASVNSAHAEQKLRAAAVGKHGLCEKPLATSVTDCRGMVDACNRWVAGSAPIEASAYAWTDDPERFREVEDNIAFRLTHADGLVCQGASSYSAVAASFVQVHGEKGLGRTESRLCLRRGAPSVWQFSKPMARAEVQSDRRICSGTRCLRGMRPPAA